LSQTPSSYYGLAVERPFVDLEIGDDLIRELIQFSSTGTLPEGCLIEGLLSQVLPGSKRTAVNLYIVAGMVAFEVFFRWLDGGERDAEQ
jgi:hypothetical protein